MFTASPIFEMTGQEYPGGGWVPLPLGCSPNGYAIVVGCGDSAHPAAAVCDAVAPTPGILSAMQQGIAAAPEAAVIAVQTLKAISQQEGHDALFTESLAYATLQGSAEHHCWLEARAGLQQVRGQGQVLTERDGPDLRIILDRPEAHNSITSTMRDALYEAFMVAALDSDIGSVTLSAMGRAFCTGAELGEFGTTRNPSTAHLIRTRTLPAHAVLGCMAKLTTRVQGACIGFGLELAAFSQRLVATPDAWFQLPELAMGLIPGAGGCYSIARRIGRQRAALMILSRRRVSARTALDWGLIDAIIDD